jgi:hypothetical protein
MSLVRTVFFGKVTLSRAPETFSTFTVVRGSSGAFCLGRTVLPTATPASSRFRPSHDSGCEFSLGSLFLQPAYLVARR